MSMSLLFHTHTSDDFLTVTVTPLQKVGPPADWTAAEFTMGRGAGSD